MSDDDTPQAAPVPDSLFSVMEEAIRAAQQGRIAIETLMWTLAGTNLLMGTPEAPTEGGTTAGTFTLRSETGQTFLPVFTRAQYAHDFFQTQYAVVVGVLHLLQTMPLDFGLVINPGQELSGEFVPEGLNQLRGELGLPPR